MTFETPSSPDAVPIPSARPSSLVPGAPDAFDPAHYLNRELSWLEFNGRVLAEAASTDVPLFERLKFLGIFFSNLDEFFMVRVGSLLEFLLRFRPQAICFHYSLNCFVIYAFAAALQRLQDAR